MNEEFEVRDYRNKAMFRVDDEYLNGYSKLCGVNATMVYLCLCRHADRKQESFPSVKLMAEKTGISDRSIIRGIAILIEWNIISKERERKENAKWLNNRYILLDKSVWNPKPNATETLGSHMPNMTEPHATAGKSHMPQVHTKVTHNKDTQKEGLRNEISLEIKSSKFTQEGAEILKAFETINPACKKMYSNKTQRQACEDLIAIYGFERIKNIIQNTLPKTNLIFFNHIATPIQLLNGYSRLEADVYKHQEKIRSQKNKIAF